MVTREPAPFSPVKCGGLIEARNETVYLPASTRNFPP